MADINNIETIQDLKDCIAEYLKTPRVPAIKGSELNILLNKTIELVPGGTQTAAEIKNLLETLTGSNRLDASAIKNLPSGGGVSGLAPTQLLYGAEDGTIEQNTGFTFNPLTKTISNGVAPPDFSGKNAVFTGDSITAKIGPSTPEKAFTSIVSAKLGLNEVNNGIGSATIGGSTGQIPNKTDQDIYLFIEFGVNDARLSGISADQFETDYRAYLNNALSKGWSAENLVMLSIIGTIYIDVDNRAKMSEFNAKIELVATEFDGLFIDCYSIFQEPGYNLDYLGGLHPNDEGSKILAYLILEKLPTTFVITNQPLVIDGKAMFNSIEFKGTKYIPLPELLGVDENGNIGLIGSLPNGIKTNGDFILNGNLKTIGSAVPDGFNPDIDILLKYGQKIWASYDGGINAMSLGVFQGTEMHFESHDPRFGFGWQIDGQPIFSLLGNGGKIRLWKNILVEYDKIFRSEYTESNFAEHMLFGSGGNSVWKNSYSGYQWWVSEGETDGTTGLLAAEINNMGGLVLNGTKDGFRMQKLTTTQRDAIADPQPGTQIYNTTTNKINFHNGTEWRALTDEAA